jgi:PAS domain S-box-containing protein/putative nucleotidyltransferase with HDIG domain
VVEVLPSRRPVDAELIAEAIPHIVWTATPDGSTTYFNRRGTDYTGHPPETNYGWNWVTLVHPDDADRARAGWEAAVRDGTDYALEYRIRRYDGVYLWHSFRAQPVRDDDGVILAWIGTATDIEDQKQLELSLRRAENEAIEALTLLRSIEASTPIGVKLVDRDLRIIRVNETLARINGLSIEEQLGRPVCEIIPDLWPELKPVYERALAGEATANVEICGPSAEIPDQVRYWLGSYYPVRVDSEIIGVGNVVVDITELKQAQATISRNLAALVDTIATTVEYRDPYTAGHQERVAQIATAIAQELGLESEEIDGIRTAASIHDLGKISIPAEILTKPGVLSGIEMQLIQEHAEAGYRIVSGIDFPWPVADMIRQHHERLDGSGYPLGLTAGDILLGARIVAVADVVEAMMAHRPYRPAHGVEEALRQIASDRGTLLDRDAVDACLRLFHTGRLSAEMTIVEARIAHRSRRRTDTTTGQVPG